MSVRCDAGCSDEPRESRDEFDPRFVALVSAGTDPPRRLTELLVRGLPDGCELLTLHPHDVQGELSGAHALLIDAGTLRGESIDLTRAALAQDAHRPVIVLVPSGLEDLAIEAFRWGASDCLLEDRLTPAAVRRSLSHSLEKARMQRELTVRNLLLDSVDQGVLAVDRQRRITTANQAAARMLGVAVDQLIGRPCPAVLSERFPGERCVADEILESGRALQERVFRGKDPHGRSLAWSVYGFPLGRSRDHLVGAAVVLRDLADPHRSHADVDELEGLQTRSPSMRKLLAKLPSIARSESTVLVEGPSGSGKELVARAVHNLSGRRNGPFVAVNCASIPDTLLESELFGYRAGAFTGADRDKPGRFAAAEGGTLFLDEIGDLPTTLQTRLLRVLQEKTVEPLGATQPLQADVRIVAATNRDLDQAVREGCFRADLYYRLRVLHLALPPLRNRREDIPLLAERFLEECATRQKKEIAGFEARAMDVLTGHDYPGNVRELRNAVEHAVALCDGSFVDVHDLPEHLRSKLDAASAQDSSELSFDRLQRTHIEDLLARHRGNRSAVAKALGVHLSTLYRKIQRLGVRLPDTDGRHRSD